MDARNGRPEPECTIWLWDGTQEYEGIVTKIEADRFAAHVREARREAARPTLGRRMNTTFFDLQRQFVGRRYLAYCKLGEDPQIEEAEIRSVQRSSSLEFDYFVSGVIRELDSYYKEALKKMSFRDVGAMIAERLGRFDEI